MGTQFLTARENIALRLIFYSLGEELFNRSMQAYADIAAQAPKLESLHQDVNALLGRMAATGYAPYRICNFKAGHTLYRYEDFPASLSREVVRRAWVKSGMRQLQRENR